MDFCESSVPFLHNPSSYTICYEAGVQVRNDIPSPVEETEVMTVRPELSFQSDEPDSLMQTFAHTDVVTGDHFVGDEFLDLENAIPLPHNCIIELQGTKYVVHINHDTKQVLAVPLRMQPVEPLTNTSGQEVGQDGERAIDVTALASLLGRRGRGRPRKERGHESKAQVSLLLLSPAPCPALLVQLRIDDVPPTLPPSVLCDRVLTTMLSRQDEGTSASFDVSTDQGELTLNASIAVFNGVPDWVRYPLVIPLEKSDPVEDEAFLKKRAAEPVQNELVQCPSCGFQSFYEAHLSEHLIQEHGTDKTGRGMHLERCIKCSLSLANKQALVEHYVRRHPNLVCAPCGVVVEQQYLMRKHNERHDEAAPRYCELCGKNYKDRYILKSHIKLVHGQAEIFYQCEVCRKQFERKAHLVRHMRTHTDDMKPFACNQCPYRARERGDLNKHMRGHGEPSFPCGHCDKWFAHLKSLRLHEKRHGGVRDYKCALCDFSAFTYNHVRKHIERTHATIANSVTGQVLNGGR
ncbi:myoneurin-like isoform X1 [Varroa jacobsoni]|uniref:myoneurin-like isoform X1 n=1 Tax=Varroa jacobsoni TaxID=62625 RepID=UPI000BF926A2|nr:myoneurin-like isoform X1 [Varroa jacobsoni]XP_022709029.1 myoneurin-like isoform X1 [Varroa jacobsoni]XP_022709030.1 myoneurin-like isoform X1 [Varroa jacobsoni]XP_022709031.1 myoneurin-like isoform X1 [Varroa jacobsoni]XP_022709032.1 myoneurin-like isoform X1 [Varroa jacobsoni]